MKQKSIALLKEDIIFNEEIVDYGTNYYYYMLEVEAFKTNNQTIRELSGDEYNESSSQDDSSKNNHETNFNKLFVFQSGTQSKSKDESQSKSSDS